MEGPERTGADVCAARGSQALLNDEYICELPTFDEFVVSPKYLGQPPPSRRQRRAVMAVIGEDPYAVFSNRDLPNEGVFAWGIPSSELTSQAPTGQRAPD